MVSAPIRCLTEHDLSDAAELSCLAGWNQTPEDWRMLLKLEPEECFGTKIEGRVVATASLLRYGNRLAWLGMVLTHPDFRRRGLARQLISHSIERANCLGMQTIKLDATEEGRPLYESFGFRCEQAVERWLRKGGDQRPVFPPTVPLLRTSTIGTMDFKACGYDRLAMLERIA